MMCIIYREVTISLSKSQFRAKKFLVYSLRTLEAGIVGSNVHSTGTVTVGD